MEHFTQTNVFARIRTVFARIWTVFAHLIIGCAIRYPKIGSLRYIDYWVEGVLDEAYHKIQIVSCASAKITLNDGISA